MMTLRDQSYCLLIQLYEFQKLLGATHKHSIYSDWSAIHVRSCLCFLALQEHRQGSNPTVLSIS